MTIQKQGFQTWKRPKSQKVFKCPPKKFLSNLLSNYWSYLFHEDIVIDQRILGHHFAQKTATDSRHQDLFRWLYNLHQEWGEEVEGAALEDQTPPPVGPAFPDTAAQWQDSLVHLCLFGLLTLHYPRGFMGLYFRSLVIWDYAKLHQILNIHLIYYNWCFQAFIGSGMALGRSDTPQFTVHTSLLD